FAFLYSLRLVTTDTYTLSLHDALPILKIDNDVVVYGFDDGVLEMVMIQFVPSPVVTLTPIATGVPPGPVIRPDTITYSTAASTTAEEPTTELPSSVEIVFRLLLVMNFM